MSKKDPEDRKRSPKAGGLNRRSFITTTGAGAMGVAAAGTLVTAKPAAPLAKVLQASEKVKLTLKINGRAHDVLVEPRWSLLHVLREELNLSGTKMGCDRGECGACTVLIGDKTRYSCLTLALEADGVDVTTVEGLLEGEDLGDVQQAFLEHDAYQCGYCTPGQIMAVEGLLRVNAEPSLEEIREGVSGNLCRCGTYPNIFKAAYRAAELKREKGGRS